MTGNQSIREDIAILLADIFESNCGITDAKITAIIWIKKKPRLLERSFQNRLISVAVILPTTAAAIRSII